MRNFSMILNVILALAVGFLYYLHFKKPESKTVVTTSKGVDTLVTNPSVEDLSEKSKILYVDIDTINENYSFIKNQRAVLEKQQKQAEATLKSKAEALQKEFMSYQQKMQAGELTQVQAADIEKTLTKKQQDIMTQEQKLGDQLISKTEKIQKELNEKMKTLLNTYLEKYQADFIFGYTEGGQILQSRPQLNITKEVLSDLNASAAAKK